VHGGTLLWLLCSAQYVFLEPLAGAVASLFYLALLAHAQHLYATSVHSLHLALAAHLVGWVAQVAIGHALLEKRRPALMTSLFSSLILAPCFVVNEVRARREGSMLVLAGTRCRFRDCTRRDDALRLGSNQVMFASGYKPALHAELRARVSREVGAWRAAQAQQKRR
jgi:uncharacterized membrane protein YGL010W